MDVLSLYNQHFANKKRRPDTGLSLQSANYLAAYLSTEAPRSILDLGSGFSSWLFHLWAMESPDTHLVVTIDHDPLWLHCTQGELIEIAPELPSRFYTLDEFYIAVDRGLLGEFDMVFLDLAKMTRRNTWIERAADRVVGNHLFIDDWHKPHLRETAEPMLVDKGFSLHPLEKETVDQWGRYMIRADRG